MNVHRIDLSARPKPGARRSKIGSTQVQQVVDPRPAPKMTLEPRMTLEPSMTLEPGTTLEPRMTLEEIRG
jgi:hypothetical protein